MAKVIEAISDIKSPETEQIQTEKDRQWSNTSVLGPGRAGTHKIKFMFRKINISKKKQFYQEIPIENMRYLKQKENISFHQICLQSRYSSIFPPKFLIQ